jgi:hypothetical protein
VPGTEHLQYHEHDHHDYETEHHDHDESHVNGHDESLVEETAG